MYNEIFSINGRSEDLINEDSHKNENDLNIEDKVKDEEYLKLKLTPNLKTNLTS